jgi:hypothetical protein
MVVVVAVGVGISTGVGLGGTVDVAVGVAEGVEVGPGAISVSIGVGSTMFKKASATSSLPANDAVTGNFCWGLRPGFCGTTKLTVNCPAASTVTAAILYLAPPALVETRT